MSNVDLIKKALDYKLANDIQVIDFANSNPFYDYFIIGTALNDRMANSIIDNVAKVANENKIHIRTIEKGNDSGWVIIDLYEIVVHIFTPVVREVYSLERLWGDYLI